MNGQWQKERTCDTNTINIFRYDSATFNDFVQLRSTAMNDDRIKADAIEKTEA